MRKISVFVLIFFIISILFGISGFAMEESQETNTDNISIFTDKLPVCRDNTPDTINAYLKENGRKIGLPVNGSFKYTHTSEDHLGIKHLRYQQEYQGIPVFGKQIIVDIKGKDVLSLQGMVSPDNTLKNAKLIKKINEEKAKKIAEEYIGVEPENIKIKINNFEKEIKSSVKASLVWLEKNEEHILTYCIDISFLKPKVTNKKIFVDANTAEIVHVIDNIKTDTYVGTGKGVLNDTKSLNLYYAYNKYYFKDVTLGDTSGKTKSILTYDFNTLDYDGYYYPMTDDNGILCENNSEFYNQRAGVDAHYYFNVVYKYYKNFFNRISYDNAGTNIFPVVHYTEDGYAWDNAAWTGNNLGLFLFGDGDNYPGQQQETREFSAGLDVVGHEFTHAVTENNGSGGLIYEYQSGAIDESYADLFGQIIERNIKNESDWLLGEDICIGSNDDMRSLSDPEAYGQPSKMSQYVETTEDHGGVHTNSGIPNKAAYLIATQLGDTKTAEIYYYALLHKLTPSTDFLSLRRALIDSAKILYPGTGTAAIIGNAFNQVEVYDTLSLPQIDSITVDKESPQNAGTTITFTANGSGGSERLYRFWLNSGSGWTLAKNYSASNTFTWTPTAAGTYQIEADVKNANSANDFDDYMRLTYVINEAPALPRIDSITVDKTSPQNVGTTITFTANGSGGSERLYRFWLDSGRGWTLAKNYSASNTFPWTPTAAGTYQIEADVKNANSANDFDDYTRMTYVISEAAENSFATDEESLQVSETVPDKYKEITTATEEYQKEIEDTDSTGDNSGNNMEEDPADNETIEVPTISSITVDIESPQEIGTTITLTVNGSGGSERLYRFWLDSGRGWELVQDYSESDTYEWIPTEAGEYQIQADVKDSGSTNDFDDQKLITYTIYAAQDSNE